MQVLHARRLLASLGTLASAHRSSDEALPEIGPPLVVK